MLGLFLIKFTLRIDMIMSIDILTAVMRQKITDFNARNTLIEFVVGSYHVPWAYKSWYVRTQIAIYGNQTVVFKF